MPPIPKPQGFAQWVMATSALVLALTGLFGTVRKVITWLNVQDQDVVAMEAEYAPAVKELRELTKQQSIAVEELKTQSRGVQTWATDTVIQQVQACDRADLPRRLCEGVYARNGLDDTYGVDAEED